MLISFIIPTFNSGRTLGKCLESIKDQDVKKEVLVVDGGSTDSTQNIARKSGAKLIIEKKKGIAPARNAGLSHAKGNYIAFVDSDVVLPKGWAKKAIELLGKDSKTAAVGGPGIGTDNSLVSLALDALLFGKGSHVKKRFVNSLATMDAVYKRDAIRGMKFDEDMFAGEDPEFNFRLRKRGFRLLYDRDLWVHHHHPTGLGGMLRKWYNYGKSYPLLGSKHRELRTPGFWARVLYLPGFLALSALSLVFPPLAYLAGLQVLVMFLYYFAQGIVSSKGFLTLVFPFIHTMKQVAHMVGHIVGLKYLFRK